eukprot:13448810-Alexandrium_andersonii.AAC.1
MPDSSCASQAMYTCSEQLLRCRRAAPGRHQRKSGWACRGWRRCRSPSAAAWGRPRSVPWGGRPPRGAHEQAGTN